MQSLHLHLVSDSSGETVSSIARACLVQFDEVAAEQHLWWLVRTPGQAHRVIEGVRARPGIVLYTVLDPEMRSLLERGFAELEVPHVPVLEPVLQAMSMFLGVRVGGRVGRQHTMDAAYFRRIDAIHFAIDHDDGQSMNHIEEADVIVFGVSRTSKTPTCMYLANRGVKAVNVPVVPGIPLPPAAVSATGPFKVGLTREATSLADIRRSRLRQMGQADMSYADEERVREEVQQARRLYARLGIPVIDVTRRSIEEVSASILQMMDRDRGQPGSPGPGAGPP